MEHKLKVINASLIITSQEKKKVLDAYHKLSYYTKEKLEEREKEKRLYSVCKRNISANTLPVTSKKCSEQSAFSATSSQREGSEPVQRTHSTIFEFRITRLLIIHKDSS